MKRKASARNNGTSLSPSNNKLGKQTNMGGLAPYVNVTYDRKNPMGGKTSGKKKGK